METKPMASNFYNDILRFDGELAADLVLTAPTTAYVTCPDCKAIHQLGKCREYAYSAPPQPIGTLPAGANILDEVSLLVSAVREFEQHSYVTGDPVGGCGECLRLFDRLIAQTNTTEIAMRTKSQAGQACSSADREAALEEAVQLADPEKYTCEDSCAVGKVRDAIRALKTNSGVYLRGRYEVQVEAAARGEN